MWGHRANVSRRAASLNMKARSGGDPSKLEGPRSSNRPLSRSLMAEAIGNAGMCLFNFFNSATKPADTTFSVVCGNSMHRVFH